MSKKRRTEAAMLRTAEKIGEAKERYESTTRLFAWLGIAAGLWGAYQVFSSKEDDGN